MSCFTRGEIIGDFEEVSNHLLFLLLYLLLEEKQMTEEIWNTQAETKTEWIFADDLSKLPLTAHFRGVNKEISKNGANEFYVLALETAGTLYKLTAGFNPKQIMKRVDCRSLIEKYPKQDDAIGKLVKLSHNGTCFVVEPIEENIAEA